MVAQMYKGLDERLWPAAGRSVLAHLSIWKSGELQCARTNSGSWTAQIRRLSTNSSRNRITPLLCVPINRVEGSHGNIGRGARSALVVLGEDDDRHLCLHHFRFRAIRAARHGRL